MPCEVGELHTLSLQSSRVKFGVFTRELFEYITPPENQQLGK